MYLILISCLEGVHKGVLGPYYRCQCICIIGENMAIRLRLRALMYISKYIMQFETKQKFTVIGLWGKRIIVYRWLNTIYTVEKTALHQVIPSAPAYIWIDKWIFFNHCSIDKCLPLIAYSIPTYSKHMHLLERCWHWNGKVILTALLLFTKTESSSEWLTWSSLETLKLVFNVSSDDQGSHPDDLSVSVLEAT